MPWTDETHLGPDAADAARVDARTQLTIILTDLEVTQRVLARAAGARVLTPSDHAALVELNGDAIQSALRLAAGLRDGQRVGTRHSAGGTEVE